MAAALRAAASNRSPLGAALVMLWLPARSSCVIVPPATQVAVHSLRKHQETWQQGSHEPSILSLGQDSSCHTMLAGWQLLQHVGGRYSSLKFTSTPIILPCQRQLAA